MKSSERKFLTEWLKKKNKYMSDDPWTDSEVIDFAKDFSTHVTELNERNSVDEAKKSFVLKDTHNALKRSLKKSQLLM